MIKAIEYARSETDHTRTANLRAYRGCWQVALWDEATLTRLVSTERLVEAQRVARAWCAPRGGQEQG